MGGALPRRRACGLLQAHVNTSLFQSTQAYYMERCEMTRCEMRRLDELRRRKKSIVLVTIDHTAPPSSGTSSPISMHTETRVLSSLTLLRYTA